MAIRMIDEGDSLAFPDFKDGAKLPELITVLAAALETQALRPIGSPLERLIHFAGYPERLALWWDGFTCELGTGSAADPTMDDVRQRLLASERFSLAE